jgi:quinol monooxygenase YgiN
MQTTKPAVGSEEIYWVITVDVLSGRMDAFKQIVSQLVAATKEEPGTLEYKFNISADQNTVDVFERYRDSDAVVAHVSQTFGPKFSEAFLAIANPTRFTVYGTPNLEVKKVLAGFNPIYMSPLDGFSR